MAAQRRRTKGDGGLWQRADGMWIGTVEAGFDEKGRRLRRYVSSRNHATALAKLREARAQKQRHGTIPTRSMTVEAWLDTWLDAVVQVRPSTLANYRSTARVYLVPRIGRHRLDLLAPQHVRDMLAWITTPKPDGLGLSASTAHRAHRILRKALADAVHEGILVKSPVDAVRAPSIAGTTSSYLSVDQAKALMRSSWDSWWGPRWGAALLTGARQGEVLGMQWSRVNLAARTIDVSWQLQRVGFRHGCGGTCGLTRPGACPQRELDVPSTFMVRPLEGGLCLTRPKTAAGTRLVPIAEPMAAYLQRQAGQAQGIPSPHGLVFHREDGRPIDPSADSKAWHAALEAAGLPPVKLHAARHTTATLLLQAGVDRKVIQAIMGHSSAAMTMAYQHVDTTLSSTAMAAMADLLGTMPGHGNGPAGMLPTGP